MAARNHIALLVACAALCAAGGAGAKVYVEFRPRMSLMAGYDDNVQMDGRGADGFGQAVPGLKLDLFGEHNLHLDLDCQAGIARLAHPEEFGLSSGAFATSETCVLGTKVHLAPRDKLSLRTSATYAQDPFAIAGLGLLLRPGQTQVFVAKFQGEVAHALTGHSEVDYGLEAQALAFGAGDLGNGYVLAPQVKYGWKTSARSKWELGVREQLFFGVGAEPNSRAPRGAPGGLLDEAHSALLGYVYDLTPWADLKLRGGAVVLTGPDGTVVLPTGRFEIESYTPSTAMHLMLAHDLMIGPTSAGPLMADLAEAAVIQDWGHLNGRLRLGLYRNANAFNAFDLGSIGYAAEAAVGWAFTRNLKMEVAAVRDARLNDMTVGTQVDRNVVQLRLTWEKARFE